jgi:hypothetical protein
MCILTSYNQTNHSLKGKSKLWKDLDSLFRSPIFNNIFCNTFLGKKKIKAKKDTLTMDLRTCTLNHPKFLLTNAGSELFGMVLFQIQLFWDLPTLQSCLVPPPLQYKIILDFLNPKSGRRNHSKGILNYCARNMEAEGIIQKQQHYKLTKRHVLKNMSIIFIS